MALDGNRLGRNLRAAIQNLLRVNIQDERIFLAIGNEIVREIQNNLELTEVELDVNRDINGLHVQKNNTSTNPDSAVQVKNTDEVRGRTTSGKAKAGKFR
jgi:hypothetical protein